MHQVFFAVSLLIVFAYVGASAYPQPLFSHYTRYQNYEIWSDLPKADSPLLDFQRSGLYRGFHLRVSLLLDKQGLTVRQVFANPPGWRELSELLKRRTVVLPVPVTPA